MKTMISRWAQWKQKTKLQKAVDLIGLIFLLSGIGVSLFMNLVGRSFWVDEAMLSYSFSERSLLSLTDGPFEWLQSSPVLYLYVCKIAAILFGNTEFVLRSVSILAFALTMWLSWYTAKHLLRIRYAILVPAFLANMNFLLQYSNMFKQYLWECIWALLVLVVYYLYKERKLSWKALLPLYMLFVWAANPACFMIGGVLGYEFLNGIWRRKNGGLMQTKYSILIGLGVLFSFVVYYVYWLAGVANSPEMQAYWAGTVFPLIPKSIDDLKEIQALLYDIFIIFREGRLVMEGLVLAALLVGLFKEKNRYVAVIALSFFLCLFASYLGMFPVADRMWMFSYPLFVLLAFMAVDRMTARGAGEIVAVLLMLTLILTNNGILVYRHGENIFMKGEEINTPLAYVQEHCRADESVYVYYHSEPAVKYHIGYDQDSIGEGTDNIIWPSGMGNDDAVVRKDVSRIVKAGKCYILASHTTEERFGPVLNALSQRGNLEILQNQYETPLYYFSVSEKDMKLGVSYELISMETENDTCYATIRVTNTGSSYINTAFDQVVLGCRERKEIGTNLWGNLAPGASFDMPLQFDWAGDTEVKLQLKNGDKYWYEDLGFAPISLRKQ